MKWIKSLLKEWEEKLSDLKEDGSLDEAASLEECIGDLKYHLKKNKNLEHGAEEWQ